MLAKGKRHRHRRQRPELLRHPRRPAGGAAGERGAHRRDRQVRGGCERLLRGKPLEPRATRRLPSATSSGSPSPSPFTPITTAVKGEADVEKAKVEIPSMFDAGITSIAIDASHLPDDENLLASLELCPCVPGWASLETEVGEIKGSEGLSTAEEAVFLIRGLNAHGVFPDWIALNNGTSHGLEASGQGIQVELTAEIHAALAKYGISGAQHGTSGNNSDRLRRIAAETRTTKANVATALQMISWGLEVNDYGNAIQDDDGVFVKSVGEGVTEEMWTEMVEYARVPGAQGRQLQKAQPALREQAPGPVERGPRADVTASGGLRLRSPHRGVQRGGHCASGDRRHSRGGLTRPGPQGDSHRGPRRVDRGKDPGCRVQARF